MGSTTNLPKIPQTVGGLEIMVRVWEFLLQKSLKENLIRTNKQFNNKFQYNLILVKY